MFRLPGQALLTSTLVLSTILLGIAVLGISSIVVSSQSTLAIDNKRIAATAAEGCMEAALNRLGRSGSYVGNEMMNVASTTCVIRPINSTSTPITIETWARVEERYARYRTVLSQRSPILIDSWMEVGGF